MNRWIQALKLKKEAVLLGSRPFIVKTFLAIATAYVIGQNHPVASRDMISVLFGLVLTLEPVNVTGIRRGWEQVIATLIGAFTTAVIISVFGINAISASAGVAVTLYISLKVNWRQISPVALFTAIYMTQYIQLDAAGNPSIFLTFRLRMIALGIGVFTAVFYNFVFSLIQYRKMGNQRLIYLMKGLLLHMNTMEMTMRNGDAAGFRNSQLELVNVFNDIDGTTALFTDLLKEKTFVRKLMGLTDERLRSKIELTRKLRMFCHLLFDTQQALSQNPSALLQSDFRLAMADAFKDLMDALGALKNIAEGKPKAAGKQPGREAGEKAVPIQAFRRLDENLEQMHVVLERMKTQLNSL